MALGVDDGQYGQYSEQLSRIQQAFEVSSELRDLWLNPANDRESRMAAVNSLVPALQLSPFVVNVLRLLVERQRLTDLPDLARSFRDLVDEKDGRVRATVTTASAVDATMTGEISGALAAMTNKQIILETKVDPALIGGVVTRVGGTVLDGSLKTQLEGLRSQLRATRV